MGRRFWSKTHARVERWQRLGCSDYLCCAVGPSKGEWNGASTLSHLDFDIHNRLIRFQVSKHKFIKVKRLSSEILRQARIGRRWVSARALSHFCGGFVSLSRAIPWARFYTHSLYWDIGLNRKVYSHGRVCLSHQGMRELVKWQQLSKDD